MQFLRIAVSLPSMVSKETRKKMSIAAKARCTPEWRATKSEAYSTKLPEKKVRNLYNSGWTQAEIASALGVTQKVVFSFMRRHGIKTRKAAKRNQNGVANSSWKGDGATYSAFHNRVAAARGRPKLCSSCGKKKGRFEWCNLTGHYPDVADYIRLCVPCHRRLDLARRTLTGKFTSKHVPRRTRKEGICQ